MSAVRSLELNTWNQCPNIAANGSQALHTPTKHSAAGGNNEATSSPSRWQQLRASWNYKDNQDSQAILQPLQHNSQHAQASAAPLTAPHRHSPPPCTTQAAVTVPKQSKWRPAPACLSPSEKLHLYSVQLQALDVGLNTSTRYPAPHLATRADPSCGSLDASQPQALILGASLGWGSFGAAPAAPVANPYHDASLQSLVSGRAEPQTYHSKKSRAVCAGLPSRPPYAFTSHNLGPAGLGADLFPEQAAEQVLARVSAALKPQTAHSEAGALCGELDGVGWPAPHSADDLALSATIQRIMEGARIQMMELEYQDRQQHLEQVVLAAQPQQAADVALHPGTSYCIQSSSGEKPKPDSIAYELAQHALSTGMLKRAFRSWRWSTCASAGSHKDHLKARQDRLLCRILSAWSQVACSASQANDTRAQWAIKASHQFYTVRRLYTFLKAWRACAAQAKQELSATLRAQQQLALRIQKDQHMNHVADRFHATYVKHIVLRGWSAITAQSKQQHLVHAQAAQRQKAISAFLTKLTNRQPSSPGAAMLAQRHSTVHQHHSRMDHDKCRQASDELRRPQIQVQDLPLQPQHVPQVARALGNKGLQAAALRKSSLDAVACRARHSQYSQHREASRKSSFQSVTLDSPLATTQLSKSSSGLVKAANKRAQQARPGTASHHQPAPPEPAGANVPFVAPRPDDGQEQAVSLNTCTADHDVIVQDAKKGHVLPQHAAKPAGRPSPAHAMLKALDIHGRSTPASASAIDCDDEAARLLSRAKFEEARRRRASQHELQSVTSELLHHASVLSALHYERSLLMRFGMKPWLLLMGLMKVQARRAELHIQCRQLRSAWHRWRQVVAARKWQVAVKQAASISKLRHTIQARTARHALRALHSWALANFMARYRHVASAFACWRLLVSWARLAHRDGMLHHRAHSLKAVIRCWKHAALAMAGERLAAELQQHEHVKQHLVKTRGAQVLRAWRDLVAAAQLEAQVQERQANTWRKIQGWLSEMPPSALNGTAPARGSSMAQLLSTEVSQFPLPHLSQDRYGVVTRPSEDTLFLQAEMAQQASHAGAGRAGAGRSDETCRDSWVGDILATCEDWRPLHLGMRKELSESAAVGAASEPMAECSRLTAISAADASHLDQRLPHLDAGSRSLRREKLQQYLAFLQTDAAASRT